jgi:ribose 5-phosphate isomerase B
VKILSEMSIPFKDVGTDNKSDSDYSTYAKLALNVSNKSGGIIIGICRSGQGVNIAINKLSDKICALIRKQWSVKLAREHNCATAFALSEEALIDLSDKQLREMLLDMFMPFEGGRHSNRLIEVLNEHN